MKTIKMSSKAVLIFFWVAVASVSLFAGGEKEVPLFAYQDRVGDASAILTAGNLEDSGLFETRRFSSGGLCAEALISGTAQIATMGDAVAVELASRYPDSIVLLGVHGEGSGRHRLVKIKETPAVIGVKFGTSTHAALLSWLSGQGEAYSKAELIDMSPATQIAALASGEIDALAASEPTPSIALEKIADTRAVSLTTAGRNYPILLVTTRKALEKYPKAIELLESELSGQENEISNNIGYIAGITNLSEPLLKRSLELHDFGYHPVADYIDELEGLADFLIRQGIIDDYPDWKAVVR